MLLATGNGVALSTDKQKSLTILGQAFLFADNFGELATQPAVYRLDAARELPCASHAARSSHSLHTHSRE